MPILSHIEATWLLTPNACCFWESCRTGNFKKCQWTSWTCSSIQSKTNNIALAQCWFGRNLVLLSRRVQQRGTWHREAQNPMPERLLARPPVHAGEQAFVLEPAEVRHGKVNGLLRPLQACMGMIFGTLARFGCRAPNLKYNFRRMDPCRPVETNKISGYTLVAQ